MRPEQKAYYPISCEPAIVALVERARAKKVRELSEELSRVASLDVLDWCQVYGVNPTIPSWFEGFIPDLTAWPDKADGAWRYMRREGANTVESYISHEAAMILIRSWEE